jgi:hypothetical protein
VVREIDRRQQLVPQAEEGLAPLVRYSSRRCLGEGDLWVTVIGAAWFSPSGCTVAVIGSS